MPAVQTRLDISAVTIASVDQKQFMQSGSLITRATTFEGRSVVDRHNRPIRSAQSVEVQVSLYSDVSTNVRVGMKDVTSITLGGNAFTGHVTSFTINKTFNHAATQGANALWLFPVYAGEETTASISLMVPLTDYPDFVAGVDGTAQSNVKLDLSITVNSVTISMPFIVTSITNSLPQDGMQMLELELAGDGVATAPSGTSTLLSAALNAPDTAVAINAVTKATNGSTWAGNALIQSISISCSDGSPLITSLTYASQDAWTIT